MAWKLPPERDGTPPPDDLVERRRAAEAMAALPPTPGVKVDEENLGGVPCMVCTPDAPQSTVLYFHGGGYRLGSSRAWTSFATRLASRTEARVVVPDYRLAPEHPFPAPLHDAAAVYDALAPHQPVVLAGDSAGGGLAVALAVACIASAKPAPGGLVALSPWVDLTVTSATFASRAQTDQLFPKDSAVQAAETYLQGADPRDPLASPLFADLRGFPPSLVLAGGAETLLGDSLSLVTRLAEAGAAVDGHFPAGMQHVWPTIFPDLPESEEALRVVVGFLHRLAMATHAS